MNVDVFDRIDAELSWLTAQGMHLDDRQRAHRRHVRLLKRGLLGGAVTLVMAASLVSEFPATASGHPPVAVATVTTEV